MAREKIKDSKGREFEIDFPDDDDAPDGGDGDDGSVLEIPEEAVEWLIDQFNLSKQSTRQRSSSATPPKTDHKVIKIRAKQSADSQSSNQNSRRRVLKIG